MEATAFKFDRHGVAVDRFEEAVAQGCVDFESCADDGFSDVGMRQVSLHRGIKLGRCQPAKLLILSFILCYPWPVFFSVRLSP
jgi:hypothetical protein